MNRSSMFYGIVVWHRMCGLGARGDYKKHVGGQKDFMQLIEELLNKLPLEEFELFLVQTWLI